jgi:hypothetical protein
MWFQMHSSISGVRLWQIEVNTKTKKNGGGWGVIIVMGIIFLLVRCIRWCKTDKRRDISVPYINDKFQSN